MYEELNKKLLKFAGFKRVKRKYASAIGEQAWEYPDGEWDLEKDMPDFTDPMWGVAYCFKWLVPEVLAKGFNIHIHLVADKQAKVVISNVASTYSATSETLAPALCLAIEKLIKV